MGILCRGGELFSLKSIGIIAAIFFRIWRDLHNKNVTLLLLQAVALGALGPQCPPRGASGWQVVFSLGRSTDRNISFLRSLKPSDSFCVKEFVFVFLTVPHYPMSWQRKFFRRILNLNFLNVFLLSGPGRAAASAEDLTLAPQLYFPASVLFLRVETLSPLLLGSASSPLP